LIKKTIQAHLENLSEDSRDSKDNNLTVILQKMEEIKHLSNSYVHSMVLKKTKHPENEKSSQEILSRDSFTEMSG
jgi:hypothetical protein